MKLTRMFSYDAYKGTIGYLDTQRKYEIARTVLYFLLALALFLAGYLTTKTRANLLTVVAVLGCLPACKSLVSAILFCRYKSLNHDTCLSLEEQAKGMTQLFDMVFTSYEKTYPLQHLVVRGNTICGYSLNPDFPEADFQKHILTLLKHDNIQNVTVKVFTDLEKYEQRLAGLSELPDEGKTTAGIAATLKSVSL